MNIPQNIKDAIVNNNLVIFAGAGLSTKFGLPSWSKLVTDVINSINKEDYNTLIPVLQANIMSAMQILNFLKDEHLSIRKYIKDNFSIIEGDLKLHKELLKLTNSIITTNYDNAFELASENKIKPADRTSDFNISEINKNGKPYIFKIHGTYESPDSCVIFSDDYANIYSRETSSKEKLKSIFTEKTILFLGFSFNDPDINLIFKNLDIAFSNFNQHYILTTDPNSFKEFKFLNPLKISDHSEIDGFIEECLKFKKAQNLIIKKTHKQQPNVITKICKVAYLQPQPLDLDTSEINKVINYFDSLEIELFEGYLNIKTLSILEDYDFVIIVSKAFKSNIYIEEENLKSGMMTATDICFNIPNDKLPVIFITNEKIELPNDHPTINISSFKNTTIKRFIYKVFKENKLNIEDDDIRINLSTFYNDSINKGDTQRQSIYGNNRILEIGKKSLTNVIGRIEEQSSLTLRLLSIMKSHRVLNIKASGGTGKTTLIKKVAYELYNRGFYKDGVRFKSCESVRSFLDFEELIVEAFGLSNIINFKDYLIENYSNAKLNLLIILDNFETVANSLTKEELLEVKELLMFASDFANLTLTSREKFSFDEDFEDVFSLTPLITDDALELFQKSYGNVIDEKELRILRVDILEELLNNNPLAIKLVTRSRTTYSRIELLKEQLNEHFFESTNEDYSLVFKNSDDLNIERTKSIYQCINYSYTTLNVREKTAFELLSLFPDGISLNNFKKCFEKSNSSNKISDKELRILRDKSLLEDYNGILQLQPIIRRFAEYQFSKEPYTKKKKYCLDAFLYNEYICNYIDIIEKEKSRSAALNIYNNYKNNLLNVLSYIQDVEIDPKGDVYEKEYLLNYIYNLNFFVINEKQIIELENKLSQLEDFFADVSNAVIFMHVLQLNKIYFFKEFDNTYKELSKYLSIEEMLNRDFKSETSIENLYKGLIANIHSMEGHTLQRLLSYIKNDDVTINHNHHFFYLGIGDNLSRNKIGFYSFEYDLMFNRLNTVDLEKYIKSIFSEEHLEIMQSTYTLSKIKPIDKEQIRKLVVTNPYTKGLKELMYAFNTTKVEEKLKHYEKALKNLFHIKYYYLEALYYYCLFLGETDHKDYDKRILEGQELSRKYCYQYLNFLFDNIRSTENSVYKFSYNYYNESELENYVNKHNKSWTKILKERAYD